MMSKINHQLKGRIRDKVKQVILIEGIPEILYNIRKLRVTVIKFNSKIYRLDIPTDLMKELKKLPTITVEESTRISKQFKPLLIPGLGHRTTIKAVNGNTHITVGGTDETQLSERIQLVREYLLSLGINTIERCHWTCVTDKAKLNTDYQYPHKIQQESEQLKALKPVMSEKTKSLHEIALKAIKESEAKQ